MRSSIILTIHQKESLLPISLNALKQYTKWDETELICILDGCTDGSKRCVEDFRFCNRGLPITILESPDVYETRANNVGCKASQADYVIIIQDDQVIGEKDWNIRILKPFTLFRDIFAVSGNCAHNWKLNENSEILKGITLGEGKWSDLLIHFDHANKTNTPRNVFAIRDSCNRGPLAIDRREMEALGYFDEAFSPLSDDDHDLMYKAKKELNKVCGYYGIDFINGQGGTRNTDGTTKQWVLDVNIKNSALLYERHKDIMNNHVIKDIEI